MRIPSAVILFLALFLTANASAQHDPSGEPALIQAALDGNVADVARLAREHRTGVKPHFQDLSRRYADAVLSGQVEMADRFLRAVGMISTSFEKEFGESGLSHRYAILKDLTRSGLSIKIDADSLFSTGVALRTTDREQAFELFQRADSLYTNISDEAGKAETLGQMGYVNWWLNRPDYLTYNDAALTLRRKIDDWQLIGNSLNDLGLYNRIILRDFGSAVMLYTEAEAIRWQIGDSLALSRMLPNLGLSYEGLSDYTQAEEYYLKASDLYLAVGDTARSITQRNNAAGLLTDFLGRHSEAMYLFLELQEELEQIDDSRARALVLNSLGIVNRRLGNYEAAILSYREVVRLSEENGFSDLLGGALNNIGVVYLWVGRTGRAVPFLERALEQYQADEALDEAASSMQNLGTVYRELGDYEKSEAYLRESLQTGGLQALPIQRATTLAALGNTLLKSGAPDLAIASFEEAMKISEGVEAPALSMGILFGLGDAAERAGDAHRALSYYDRGFQQIENSRGLLTAEEDKAGFIAQSRYVFEDVVDFLTNQALDTGDSQWAEIGFDFAERSKARAFLDQLAESLAEVKRGVDPDLLDDQQILTENISFVRTELAETDPADRDRVSELKQFMREQETEYDRVEREIRARNPRYADLKYPDPVSLTDVQHKLLGPDDVLLQYAVGDSSSTLWVVTREAFSVHRLPTRTELQSQIDLIRFATQNYQQSTPASYSIPARRLFEQLLSPALASVTTASNLIIIPDDVLHYLPFELLLTDDSGADAGWSDLSYLIRDFNVTYGQSASVLLQLQKVPREAPSHDFLAIGDPEFSSNSGSALIRGASLSALPFSGTEVNSIASLFDENRADILMDRAATETRVKELLASNRYRYVHFATHGLINDDRPDFSALALAADDSQNDGMLQAAEIFNLNIQSDLVVLSACETGLGQLVRGEGMVGLTRAFMYAGAPSLVVSLWSVSDESTSLLMQAMYDGLINRADSKQRALRNAKLSLLNNASTAHPFFWAPFVLIGEGS